MIKWNIVTWDYYWIVNDPNEVALLRELNKLTKIQEWKADCTSSYRRREEKILLVKEYLWTKYKQ